MLLFPFFAQAQRVWQGRVLDALNKEPLVGASLVLLGTGSGAVSGLDGTFELLSQKNPPLSLQCSYVGYASKTILLETADSQGIVISLMPLSVELEGVEVSASATGALRGFLQQRVSDHIKNVLVSEQIEKFPDVNAAEAIQRIPGVTLQRDQGEGRYVQLRGTPPELTTFNVNGEQMPSPEGKVRYVGLDILSVDQVDLIEVTKVFTPDMDADGIGGNVNVVTKSPTTPGTELKWNASLGYNVLRARPVGQMQFSFHQKTGRLGFGVVGNYYETQQAAENIEFEFGKGPFYGNQSAGKDNYSLQYREAQLRYYEVDRQRVGISPVLTYSVAPGKEWYLKGLYSFFSDSETRRRIIHTLDDAVDFNYYLYGGVERDVKQRTKNQHLASVSLGGKWKWEGLLADFQVTVSRANESEPDRLEANFENPGQAIPVQMEDQNSFFPTPAYPTPAGTALANDFSAYTLNTLLFERSYVDDRNLAARANLTIPYRTNAWGKGSFKWGGKIRYKDKTRDLQSSQYGAYFENVSIYPGSGPKLSTQSISDGFAKEGFFGQPIAMRAMPGANEMRDFFEFYPQHFIYDRTATKVASYGEDYQADERIDALYGMVRHEWNRLTVLAGLRLEHTRVDYQGFQIVTNRARFIRLDTLTDRRVHRFLLPQFQLNYRLPNNANLRAALTHSYARPNFEDVLPYREQDRAEVKYGNPDLNYPFSRNADLIWERYFPDGLVSVGLFHKRITDFVFFYKRFAHEGDPANYSLVEINKAINGEVARLGGAELMFQRKFWFLGRFLKDMGLYANYTFTRSRAGLFKRLPANYTDAVVEFGKDDLSGFVNPSEREILPLPGQAAHAANLALFYESPKAYARLSAFFQSAFLYRLGADSDLDEYYGQQLRLDFTGNVAVHKSLRFFLDAANLSDAPLTYYLGNSRKQPRLLENYSSWVRIGMKWGLNTP